MKQTIEVTSGFKGLIYKATFQVRGGVLFPAGEVEVIGRNGGMTAWPKGFYAQAERIAKKRLAWSVK